MRMYRVQIRFREEIENSVSATRPNFPKSTRPALQEWINFMALDWWLAFGDRMLVLMVSCYFFAEDL